MNLTTGGIESGTAHRGLAHWYLRLEGLVLLFAAPLLLAPDVFPVLTAAGLIALAIVWVFSLFAVPPVPTPFNVVLCLWGLALIAGILVSAEPDWTLPKATGLILGLGVWRYVVLAADNRRALSAYTGLMLILCFGFSVIGFLGLQEMEIVKVSFLADINTWRAALLPAIGGLEVHPNQLSGLICLFLPLLLSLLVAPPAPFSSRPVRLLLLLATNWTVIILVLTQSRGGWIGAMAGVYLLLGLWALVLPASNRQRALRWLAVAIAVGAIASLLWIGPSNVAQLWFDPPEETVVGTLETLNFRKELWPWALTAISDFAYTGVGLGTFRQVAFRLYPLDILPDYDIAHAHNIFLQTALDVGLPGLIVYLAMLFIAAATAWAVARRDAGFRAISLGIMAGLAALHIYGLADALALGSKPAIVFWFSLGLLAAMQRIISPSHRPPG